MGSNLYKLQPPRRRHLLKRQRRTRWYFVWMAVLVLLLVAMITVLWPHTPKTTLPADEKYFFANSRYKGVASRFVVRENSFEKTSIEYPITKIASIDQFVEQEINLIDKEFREIAARGNRFNYRLTQTVSYQVSHHTDQYISIVVHVKQDTIGAHPLAINQFWTFDKKTGQPVTLLQLLNNSDEAMASAVTQAKHKAVEIAKKRQGVVESIGDAIVAERLMDFIVTQDGKVAFPFGPGAIIAHSYGEVMISFSPNELMKYLQHPLARQLLQLPDKEVKKPTSSPVSIPQTTGNICESKLCVALTFDDGPGVYTPQLLDILREANAKATFFVLGSKVAGGAAVLQRMQHEGHQVGNHTWSHPDLARLPADAVRSEMARTNEAIVQAIGNKPTTVRAPYGSINPAVLAEMGGLGLASVLWSVDTRDWADRNSDIVCQRAVGGAQAGAIILLHDIHKTSVDAVPCIIDGLRKHGYEMVTVATLLGVVQPGVNYYAR